MRSQRLTIIFGLIGVVVCVLLFFLPGLAHVVFKQMSRSAEGDVFTYSLGAQIFLTLLMAGFGITRAFGLSPVNEPWRLVFWIYLTPLLFDGVFMIFISVLAYWQVHYELGLK